MKSRDTLKRSAPSTGSLTLGWNARANASSYVVDIATNSTFTAGLVTVPTYTTNTERDHAHVIENSGAKAVIVLWSPRSVVSRWVRAEATLADPSALDPDDDEDDQQEQAEDQSPAEGEAEQGQVAQLLVGAIDRLADREAGTDGDEQEVAS